MQESHEIASEHEGLGLKRVNITDCCYLNTASVQLPLSNFECKMTLSGADSIAAYILLRGLHLSIIAANQSASAFASNQCVVIYSKNMCKNCMRISC